MSSSDKEFEEQLIDAGNKLLDAPSTVEVLLPLLDKAEYNLSRVEQSPNKSIEDALSPCSKALVTDKLFRHADTDVMVAVASCISEITRITAPEAPFTDEQMKEAFQLIVSSFEHLDDKSSRSFTKRTSILETVAKVRSCVVMLDLECDALILQMFQHFLKAIRDYHPEQVFTSMETIMTLVIEESEDISPELLSPILHTLKKDQEGVLPIAKKLGEKVFESCSAKLKAYLGQALISLGTSVDDYSEVVNMICQNGGVENNKTDVTPAGEQEVETEVASPKSEVSNGLKQAAEDEAMADTVSVKQPEVVPQRTRLKITGLFSKDKSGKSDTEKETKILVKSKKTSKKRGRKWSSAKKSTKPVDSTPIDGEKQPGKSLDNGEDPSSNCPRSPRENQSAEADLRSGGGKEADVAHSPKETAIDSVDVSSPLKSEEPKKNEEPSKEPKGPIDSEVKENSELGKKSGGGASNEDRTPIKVKISRKGSETTNNAKKNSVKPSSEKVNASIPEEDGSYLKSLKGKNKEGPAKGRKAQQKDMAMSSSEKVADEEAVPSSKSTKKRRRDEDQPVEASKEKGKRKRTPAKEASDAKEYGEELVGTKVKVWWPQDKRFYEGVVNSFDSKKKRHKILYTDGDVETLNLRTQRWGIIQDYSVPNEEKKVSEETRESSPEMPLKKLLEMRSNKKLSAKKGKGTLSKKSEVVPATPDHKPRADSKNDENLEGDSSSKAKDNNTPNIGSKLVGLARRMTSKSKGSSDNEKEDTETKKVKSKDLETTGKGRTPRSVGKPRVKSGGSDKVKSSTSKARPKESKDAVTDSEGETSDKWKSSSSKPKSKEMEVDKDSVDEPSNKVKFSSLKLKAKETKEVGSDSGEEPSANVKSSLSKVKEKPKPKESKRADMEYGEKPSDKVKATSLKVKQKPKLKESENVHMDSGEEPSDKVKSTSSKLKEKPKPKESKDLDVGSGEEPSDKLKSSSLKQKQKQKSKPKQKEREEVDEASEEETSDKMKTNSSKPKAKPKPKKNEEVEPDSGEELSDKLKTNSSKPKPKENEELEPDSGEEPCDKARTNSSEPKPKGNEEVEPDSGEETSDSVKTNSSKPKPKAKENEEVEQDSGEETEEGITSKKEKPLARTVKPPASGSRTGKKRRRGA
ncbi:titin homolog isoform X2 [Punica granatum]|uniref:Titin homolog isoform X2 n=1 Tax=Punica granatum TaxID=22663 RepID=A0A6P8BWD9_PUNGR|nr:titin homolog isoform X2 [Punica granatum]